MSNLDKMKFDFPPGKWSVQSVTIREVTGRDELAAAKLAEAKKTTAYTELIKLAIVEVDGAPVAPAGNVPLEEWTTKTRKAVARYFDELNDVAEAALDPLIRRARGASPEEGEAAG